MLSKTITYVNGYDGQTKWVYFLIADDDLLEKYNTIWDKVSPYIKNEFDSEPVCNKFLKKKIIIMVMKLQIFMIKKFLRWTLV